MAQNSGQRDAKICSKCCITLESSQRCASTHGQPARMTERTTSVATQAILSRRMHPSAAAPSSLPSKVASTNPTMVTPGIGLGFPEYVYCLVISASPQPFFLALTSTTNEAPPNRQDVSVLIREH